MEFLNLAIISILAIASGFVLGAWIRSKISKK